MARRILALLLALAGCSKPATPCGRDLDCPGQQVCNQNTCQTESQRWSLTWPQAICASSRVSVVRGLIRGALGPVLEAPCEAGRVTAALPAGRTYGVILEAIDEAGAVVLRSSESVELTAAAETTVTFVEASRLPAMLALSWRLPEDASCTKVGAARVGVRVDGAEPLFVDCAAGAAPRALEILLAGPPRTLEVLVFDARETIVARRSTTLSKVPFSRALVLDLQ